MSTLNITKNKIVNVKIPIQNIWIKKAANFQISSNQHSLYANRGGYKKEDEIYGKIAEEAAFLYLSHFYYNLTTPDYIIHNVNNKSFDADLHTPTLSFHVKTCRENTYNSWVFEKSDPITKHPEDSDYIVPTFFSQSHITILGVFKTINILPLKPLINKNPTKLAMYIEDLIAAYGMKNA